MCANCLHLLQHTLANSAILHLDSYLHCSLARQVVFTSVYLFLLRQETVCVLEACHWLLLLAAPCTLCELKVRLPSTAWKITQAACVRQHGTHHTSKRRSKDIDSWYYIYIYDFTSRRSGICIFHTLTILMMQMDCKERSLRVVRWLEFPTNLKQGEDGLSIC